jgi:hypothetical protein
MRRTLRGMSSRAVWEVRVAEWRASGQTSKAFCEGKGFSVDGLRQWSYQLRRAEREKTQTEKPSEQQSLVRVARVVRGVAATSESDESPAQVSRARAVASQAIVVEVGEARVAVQSGFDRSTLAAVLETLATVSRGTR